MNIIVVGPNGRPSIIDMIKTFPFRNHVVIYSNFKGKSAGSYIWKRLDESGRWQNITTPSFGANDKVIRWGDRVAVSTSSQTIQYNTNQALGNASNKKHARQIMESAKIAVPKIIPNDKLWMEDYPVVLRPSHHSGGAEFFVARNDREITKLARDFNGNDFYVSEVYPKTKEFRVHCGSGKVLLVKQKPEPANKNEIAWNFAINDLPWSTIDRKDYDFNMVKLALDAVASLGLDFGAVDIMSAPTDKSLPPHVVIEVNTAPSFTPYLIEKYGTYFDKLFSSASKLQPWDYSKFTKGISLAWKNEQLKS